MVVCSDAIAHAQVVQSWCLVSDRAQVELHSAHENELAF